MYEELIKRLTACEDDCSRCPMMYDEQVEQDLVREHCAAYEAADAIERLEVINEHYENIINKHERINGDLLKKAKALQSEVEELKATKEETESYTLVQALEDAGAEVKPGTGKMFYNGQEVDPEEVFKNCFQPPKEDEA